MKPGEETKEDGGGKMTRSGADWDAWVARVTEEVMRRLEDDAAPGAGREDRCSSDRAGTDAADGRAAYRDRPGGQAGEPAPGIRHDAALAALIDHTLLKPDATEAQIRALCREALLYRFATVCIQPMWVTLAARLLEGSPVRVCTVVGFPLGATDPSVKAHETLVAIAQGAREIDMVLPVGALKAGRLDVVRRHVGSVVEACRPGIVTKVILETALLDDDEKRAACRICREEGASFVKTSTGFGPAGATVEDIRLMRAEVGPTLGVKAAGGIRDRRTALAMIEAGANRIGASASVRIVTELDA